MCCFFRSLEHRIFHMTAVYMSALTQRSKWRRCALSFVVMSLWGGFGVNASHAQTPTKTQHTVIQAEKTAEALYLALLAELQMQAQQQGVAYSLMLEAARKSGDPDVYKRAIAIALQNRAGQAALEAAQTWVKAWPQSTEALRTLLQLQLTLQKIEASGEVLGLLLKHSSAEELPDLWVALSQSYAKLENPEMVIPILEKQLRPWLDKTEQAAGAWATLGRVQLAGKQATAASTALEKALTYPIRSDNVGLLATELLEIDPDKTEKLLQAYLAQPSANSVLRMSYVRHLLNKERMSSAWPHLKILTTQHNPPPVPESWLLKGLVEHQLNRYVDATDSLKIFLNILRESPTLVNQFNRGATQALLILAQIAESRHDLGEAEMWLAEITDGEEVLSVQSRRASVLLKRGDIDAAMALIDASPDKQGNDKKAKLLTKVQLLRDNKQLLRAYTLLEDNAHHSKDEDLLYEQAMIADKLNRFQDMERLLREIINANPDHHHALNALGYALADRNERLLEAKELIKKALALAPADPFITDSLGWVKFRLGQLDEAEKLLRQALTKRPDAEIAIHLAEVLWQQGRLDDAKSMFKQAKELQSDHPALTPTMQRLGVEP